jgi:sterol desaturase/sphingolipid hydroxylase (fatty acid hydroxylase superfamily)
VLASVQRDGGSDGGDFFLGRTARFRYRRGLEPANQGRHARGRKYEQGQENENRAHAGQHECQSLLEKLTFHEFQSRWLLKVRKVYPFVARTKGNAGSAAGKRLDGRALCNQMDLISDSDIQLRAALFAILLLLVIAGELAAPRRNLRLPRIYRWLPNLAVGAMNILVLRVAFPMLGVSLAALVSSRGWGLFPLLDLPMAVSFVLSLLALDMLIWFQHRLFHQLPWLWRLHRMHHTDPDFDVTTAVRFHPFEAIISMGIKSLAILLLGIGPLAFLVFEIVLSSTSLFNHGNLRLPNKVDQILRLVIVTPDMHRVHHSVIAEEQNRNFGFNLPWWDYLFGTYKAQPEQGHQNMVIGTHSFDSIDDQYLAKLLVQPFKNPMEQTQPE